MKKLLLLLVASLCVGCAAQQADPITTPQDASSDRFPYTEPSTVEIVGLQPLPLQGSSAVLSVDVRGRMLLWIGQESKPRLFRELGYAVQIIRVSPKGTYVAVSGPRGVDILESSSAKTVFSLNRPGPRVQSLDFSSDETSLLLGGSDAKVYRWKFKQESTTVSLLERQRSFERYHGPSSVVGAVVFHPTGRVFFTGDWDGGLNAWTAYDADQFGGAYDENLFGPRFFADVTSRRRADRGRTATGIDHLSLSSDGQVLAAGTREGGLELWQVRGFQLGAVQSAHSGLLYDVAMSDAAPLIATVGRDGAVRIWSYERGSDTTSAQYHISLVREYGLPDVRQVAFLDSSTVIAGGIGGKIFALSTVKEAS